MKWAVNIAPGQIDESRVQSLIANLPANTPHIYIGYGPDMRLSIVVVKTEAVSKAEAETLALEIFTKAATAAGLELKPEIRSVAEERF